MRLVRSLRLSLVLLLLAGLSACQAAPDKRLLQYLNQGPGFGHRYTGNAEEEAYATIGDQVSYIDAYHPELRGADQVALDGTITVPEVGAVHVAGMTRTEIQALLHQKLAPYYDQNDITVAVQGYGRNNYWVLGEVGVQGPRPFTGDLTIFEAVMQAGPNQDTANLGRVRLIRPDPREPFTITVNVNDIIRTGDSTYNVRVQQNDILYVPPTLLAQIGYFLVALISPVTTVLSRVATSIFSVLRFSRFNVGGGRNNNNRNNNVFF